MTRTSCRCRGRLLRKRKKCKSRYRFKNEKIALPAAAGDEVHTDAYRDVVVASVVVVDTVGNLDEDHN